MSVLDSYTSQEKPLTTHKSRDESREDRFQFPISDFRITDSEIFNFRVKIIAVLIHIDSGVVLFKVNKPWDTLDRFDPYGIHTFKMNRSGP